MNWLILIVGILIALSCAKLESFAHYMIGFQCGYVLFWMMLILCAIQQEYIYPLFTWVLESEFHQYAVLCGIAGSLCMYALKPMMRVISVFVTLTMSLVFVTVILFQLEYLVTLENLVNVLTGSWITAMIGAMLSIFYGKQVEKLLCAFWGAFDVTIAVIALYMNADVMEALKLLLSGNGNLGILSLFLLVMLGSLFIKKQDRADLL